MRLPFFGFFDKPLLDSSRMASSTNPQLLSATGEVVYSNGPLLADHLQYFYQKTI
jgi:hypothetical protein